MSDGTKPRRRGGGHRWVILVRDRVFPPSSIPVGKRMQTVSSAAKANVMAHLAAHADGDGVAFPAQERLAQVCGLGRGTVGRTLEALEADGLIDRTGMRRGGRWTSDTVTMRWDAIAALPEPTVRAERARTERAERGTVRAERAGSAHGSAQEGSAQKGTPPPTPSAPAVEALGLDIPEAAWLRQWLCGLFAVCDDITKLEATATERWPRLADAATDATFAVGFAAYAYVALYDGGDSLVATELPDAVAMAIRRVRQPKTRNPSFAGHLVAAELARRAHRTEAHELAAVISEAISETFKQRRSA